MPKWELPLNARRQLREAAAHLLYELPACSLDLFIDEIRSVAWVALEAVAGGVGARAK